MATAQQRSSYYRVGNCQVYLAPWLATTTSGQATLALARKAVYGLFYTDGDIRKGMAGGVKPWVDLAGEGVSVDLKASAIAKTGMGGAKATVGYGAFEGSIEVTFNDTDVAHLQDVLSSTTGQLTTITAATGKAGRKSLSTGGQVVANRYVVMVQIPSTQVPGEFEHVLAYCATIDPEIKFDMKGTDLATAKVKFSLIPDAGCVNPDTLRAELYDIDEVTAAGL
jgi:hypothetical protein